MCVRVCDWMMWLRYFYVRRLDLRGVLSSVDLEEGASGMGGWRVKWTFNCSEIKINFAVAKVGT